MGLHRKRLSKREKNKYLILGEYRPCVTPFSYLM